MRRSLIQVDREQQQNKEKTIDEKNAERLRNMAKKGESVWHGIGRGFKAVAGFRMYVRLPPSAKQIWHEMYSGEKKAQLPRQPTPFPTFSRGSSTKFSGWLGSKKHKKGR